MAHPTDRSNCFIVEAFDCTQWCAIAQSALRIANVNGLRSILALGADDDPQLEYTYELDDEEIAAMVSTLDTFDPRQLDVEDLVVRIFRWPRVFTPAPYLFHTGYELPLLLDGRKKLARMSDAYPPDTFSGEDRFDHWVAKGVLHKEEVVEPLEQPVRDLLGLRTVYYTPKGEEWRIPAMKLIYQAARKSGGWNEHFTRLEGMLFGYEHWQNDWYINHCLERGSFGLAVYCCAVTSIGLAWIESSGFRALPPADGGLVMRPYDSGAEPDLSRAMLEGTDAAAVVRFAAALGDTDIVDHGRAGPRHVRTQQIPELNKRVRGSIVVVARRDD